MRKTKKSAVLSVGLILAAAVWFLSAVANVDNSHGELGRQQLDRAIRRSCVACYAAEGIYPPDLAYLTEHYGLQIDEERYTVHYYAFADNLMPDITVLEN